MLCCSTQRLANYGSSLQIIPTVIINRACNRTTKGLHSNCLITIWLALVSPPVVRKPQGEMPWSRLGHVALVKAH